MATTQTQAKPGSNTGIRILNSDPLFGEIMAFLTDEADLLDDDKHLEWIDLLADDVHYEMPGRKTVYRKNGLGFDNSFAYFLDNRDSLHTRARHNVEAPSAWYRNPTTRTHRLITNLVVRTTDVDNEYYVKSSIIMFANRFDQDVVDVVGAKRYDTLRRTPQGLKIAKRIVHVDQALLAQPFGNLFF
jgi:ethylbenzene dioxygenase subunit beta